MLYYILLDASAGGELEGFESNVEPRVTFVLDFKYNSCELEKKRFAMINRLRLALGKHQYSSWRKLRES